MQNQAIHRLFLQQTGRRLRWKHNGLDAVLRYVHFYNFALVFQIDGIGGVVAIEDGNHNRVVLIEECHGFQIRGITAAANSHRPRSDKLAEMPQVIIRGAEFDPAGVCMYDNGALQ